MTTNVTKFLLTCRCMVSSVSSVLLYKCQDVTYTMNNLAWSFPLCDSLLSDPNTKHSNKKFFHKTFTYLTNISQTSTDTRGRQINNNRRCYTYVACKCIVKSQPPSMIFILSSVDVFSSLRITSSANNYTVVLCSEYKHANYKPHPYFVTIHKPQPVSYTHLTLPTNREV